VPAAFVDADISTWPPAALAAVSASLRVADRSTSSIRLAAAVEFFRGNCVAAAAQLETALRERPRSAALLNDAAAAQACVARSSVADAGQAAMRAIDRALAAARLEPSWEAPRRTLDSAYRSLGLLDADGRTWTAPQPESATASEDVAYDALAAWANRTLVGQQPDDEIAKLSNVAVQSLRAEDRFLTDVFHATAAASGPARRALARADLDYSRGRRLYDTGFREQAGPLFQSSYTAFTAAGSPLRLEARFRHAIVLYQQRSLPTAARELEEVAAAAREAGYRSLWARTTWIRALTEMQEGFIERAASRHAEALAEFEALGDTEGAATVANSAADTMRIAGDNLRGWPMLVRAAHTLPRLANRQRRYLIVFNLSLYAQDEGLLRAAALFQNQAVAEADARGNPLTMVESRLRRAQLHVRRGDIEPAQRDVRDAERPLAVVDASSSAAVYLEAWRQRVQAEISLPEAPDLASVRFESLAAEFQRLEPAEVPSVLLEAGRAAERARDASRAERDLSTGTAFVLARGGQLQTTEFRAGYLAATWSLFHDLIGLHFDRDPADALSIAETTRQLLARRDMSGAASPLSVDIPADTLLVYFSVLRDRVLIWIMNGDRRWRAEAVPYDVDDLAADVGAFRQSLIARGQPSAGAPPTDRLSRVLQPLLAADRRVRRLLVAVDGPLGDLPFGALPAPGSRQRLVERYEIVLLPGLPQPIPDTSSLSTPHRVLAIGYNGGGAGLPLLPSAEWEAARIAAFYGAAIVKTGAAATPAGLGTAANGADVIHIAAHARANRMAPWESRLVLAPDAGTDGALAFDAVERWDLQRCRVVVLSACETSTGSRANGHGILSLATPFLHAGAHAVIGTVWPVDDHASTLFMALLHRRLADGDPPATALRSAQLAAMASDDPSLSDASTWAAYVVTIR